MAQFDFTKDFANEKMTEVVVAMAMGTSACCNS